ncbi:MAG: adenylate/guanylate cyclase domain-containing protein [Anaerolineaceae bacterium]|nr:adenylate/guanylate cyclase domain-containing protein [Anaerolineaceae bacterium]
METLETKKRIISRKRGVRILLAIGIALILSLFRWGDLLSSWRNRSTDFLHGDTWPGNEIIIVAIDDASITEFGAWPWSHDLHAQLIEKLSQARVVGVDILFDEISDPALPETTMRSGNVVFATLSVLPNNAEPGIIQAQTFIMPPSELQSAAAGLGAANVLPDSDGVIRRVPLLIQQDTQVMEVLSLQIIRHYLGMPSESPGKLEDSLIHIGSLRIPVDQWGRMRINYSGEPNTFTHVSYMDVLSGKISPDMFQDKIVLVGQMRFTGGGDVYAVPTSYSGEKMAGVEIQANIIHTILYRRFLQEQSIGSDIAVILGFVLLIAYMLPRINALWTLPVVLLLGGGYWVFAFFAFDRGLMLDLVYPTLSLGLSYVVAIGGEFTLEKANRRRVTELFGRYVPPAIVDEIIVSSEAMELSAARELEITVLFTDIRNFTSFAEKASLRKTVEILNACLNDMTEAVFAYGGTVDKFTGDGLMALFNAPLPQPYHTLQAVRAALRMQNNVLDLYPLVDETSLHYGIGVHSGRAIVGNIGSTQRLEYTAIGDTVNLAARLQGLAKGGQILISQSAYEQVEEWVEVKKVGEFQIKGRRQPVMIYEVLSIYDDPRK